MLETKQLQYFVVSADCGSFREAAKILYTTQSNVSKVIAGLEQQVGYALFLRDRKGILVTSKGKIFYQQARSLLEKIQKMEEENEDYETGVVRISTNPSSWFAEYFSEFYEQHKEAPIRYNIHTDTTLNIVQRMRKMEDEIGFVYVMPDDILQFEYELKKYQLEFEVLSETFGMLYFSPENKIQKEKPDLHLLGEVKLIQAEKDPFRKYSDWKIEENGERILPCQVAVTTNSDYIMNIMMKKNNLANISPRSFHAYPAGEEPGYVLSTKEGKILYGIIRNRNIPRNPFVEEMIEKIREKIDSEKIIQEK